LFKGAGKHFQIIILNYQIFIIDYFFIVSIKKLDTKYYLEKESAAYGKIFCGLYRFMTEEKIFSNNYIKL
jgi:hypothetical protein